MSWSRSSASSSAEDVLPCLGHREVEHLLVAPLGRQRLAGPQHPVGVLPVEVGVDVDHLRLDPDPELQAEPAHVGDQRAEAVRPDLGVDRPVAEPGPVVPAVPEPAVVQDEPLDADGGRDVGQLGQPVEAVVEVDGLPGVEHRRPGTPRVGRAVAHVPVQPGAEPVETGVRPDRDDLGRPVGLARPEHDLVRAEQLGGGQDRPAVGTPLGTHRLVTAPGEVQAPHRAVPVAEARTCRPPAAAGRRARCGRAERPAPSCPARSRDVAAGAAHGTTGRSGRAARRPPAAPAARRRGGRPGTASHPRCRARGAPAGRRCGRGPARWSALSPACSARQATRTRSVSLSTAVSSQDGAQGGPPRSAGSCWVAPTPPASSVSGAGSSGALRARAGCHASADGSRSPRSAPQCSTAGTPGPDASTTRLTPAERRCSRPDSDVAGPLIPWWRRG